MKGKENNRKGCEGTKEIRGTQGRVKTRGASVKYIRRHSTVDHITKKKKKKNRSLKMLLNRFCLQNTVKLLLWLYPSNNVHITEVIWIKVMT